jgi:hypothetical protein
MKNQNDLIFSIVGFVVLLIVVGVCIGTRPQVPVPTPPEKVNTAKPTYPQNVTPVMVNGAGGSGSGPGGGAGPSPMGAAGGRGPMGAGGGRSASAGPAMGAAGGGFERPGAPKVSGP